LSRLFERTSERPNNGRLELIQSIKKCTTSSGRVNLLDAFEDPVSLCLYQVDGQWPSPRAKGPIACHTRPVAATRQMRCGNRPCFFAAGKKEVCCGSAEHQRRTGTSKCKQGHHTLPLSGGWLKCDLAWVAAPVCSVFHPFSLRLSSGHHHKI
jgi:hypothetical protein